MAETATRDLIDFTDVTLALGDNSQICAHKIFLILTKNCCETCDRIKAHKKHQETVKIPKKIQNTKPIKKHKTQNTKYSNL